MADVRPKINLRPNVIVGEKSPPPTKLLINHGKPNFTIRKSPKPKADLNTTTTDNANNYFFTLRKTNQIKPKLIAVKSLDENENEFFKAHKKISEKLLKDNTEFICNNNNFNVENVKSISPKKPIFAKMENNRVQTAVNLIDGDMKRPNGYINGNDKPPVPYKPLNIQQLKPTTPTKLNMIEGKMSPFENKMNLEIEQQPLSPSPSSASPLSSHPNINFEPKTIVSFSKDLSTDINKYPDTVKVVKTVDAVGIDSKEKQIIEELAKIKFNIKGNGEIIPVVRNP